MRSYDPFLEKVLAGTILSVLFGIPLLNFLLTYLIKPSVAGEDSEVAFFRMAAAILFFAAGSVFLVVGIRWWKRYRLIQDMPTSKMRSVAMGFVEVKGNVKQLDDVLTAPMSGDTCVYYKYTVEKSHVEGRGQRRWDVIADGEDSIPFVLEDETASVVVDPKDAMIEVDDDFRIETSTDDPTLPDSLKTFIGRSYQLSDNEGRPLRDRVRIREAYIGIDDELYVLGSAMSNPGVESGSALQGSERVMIGKGQNEPTFFISDKDELGIVSSLRARSILAVLIGTPMAVGSLAIILMNVLRLL